MRRPRSTSPVGSYPCSVTSGLASLQWKITVWNSFRVTLWCVSQGTVACCLCLQSCGLRLSSPAQTSPPAHTSVPEWREGHVPGEFMGFSGRSFNRVLFVCCLVWGGGVGSPWNVGLSSTEASLGERRTDVRKWTWRQGGFQMERVRGLVARITLVWPHPIGLCISERCIDCCG